MGSIDGNPREVAVAESPENGGPGFDWGPMGRDTILNADPTVPTYIGAIFPGYEGLDRITFTVSHYTASGTYVFPINWQVQQK